MKRIRYIGLDIPFFGHHGADPALLFPCCECELDVRLAFWISWACVSAAAAEPGPLQQSRLRTGGWSHFHFHVLPVVRTSLIVSLDRAQWMKGWAKQIRSEGVNLSAQCAAVGAQS
jgi:hypothetical protein